jgi:hypothetical protein
MRVIVCGSRNWTDEATIRRAFSELPPGKHTIIHGDCNRKRHEITGERVGADMIADGIAIELGHDVEAYPAEWDKYGNAAGPIRNSKIAKLGGDRGRAFTDNLATSRGTADMVRKLRAAGIPTRVIGSGAPPMPKGRP